MAFQLVKPLYSNKLTSLLYHDLFDYPLTKKELDIWHTPIKCKKKYKIEKYQDYYYLQGGKKIVKDRLQREKYAMAKFAIAKQAANLLQNIPSILFIGVTGSLAMKNTKKGSDIDFLVITKQGTLWTTRLLTYTLLLIFNISIRKAGERNEEDKLCLNMWLDETDLVFEKKNIYTAHEIAQIVPLVNKNKIYEKLVSKNKWIFDFWPNAVPKVGRVSVNSTKSQNVVLSEIEKWAKGVQVFYMKGKVSREVVTPTRAFFHPFDWGEKVVSQLQKRVGEREKLI